MLNKLWSILNEASDYGICSDEEVLDLFTYVEELVAVNLDKH